MAPATVRRRASVLGALALACCLPAVAASRRAVVILERDDPASREAVSAAIELSGGRVLHAFDGLLVVDAPAREATRIAALGGLREMTEDALPAGRARGRSETFRLGLAAWNRTLRSGAGRSTAPGRIPDDPFGGAHAFLPPATPEGVVAAAVAIAAGGGAGDGALLDRAGTRATFAPLTTPYGAAVENTSEFLAGRVSVNVVLMESDGTIDTQTENWSADREALVAANVVAALDWLRVQEPQARLSFNYHVYPGRTDARARTGYEPIKRAADPAGSSGEALWVSQILGKFGYATGDRWVRTRAWAHATRLSDGSDWALHVFVADSLQDVDGRFADGRFAYTWVGGPYLVMTYDNQAWGIARMHMVLRHEILHAFYAFDEYTTSSCLCTASRGYLNGPGSNCNACNPSAAPCVMIANGDALCAPTRRQIGWADLDDDGIVDVVGEDPDTFADAAPSVSCGPLTITGTATVVAATNLNPVLVTPRRSISVARIAAVEVRDGAGEWFAAQPTDGSWNAPVETFRATLPPSASPGPRTIQFRARDDFGNSDPTPATIAATIHPFLESIPGPILVAREPAAVNVSWPPATGATIYRIFAAPSPSGPWTKNGETDRLTWIDDPQDSAYYRVSPVDACGQQEP